ncbi:hypothetical protein BASA61_004408 [Batrachochytrium salamandrivorans]|nr:hypothetical protein BASA61_004408 [Batrachochytrium salamandrivorans]
MAHQTKCKPTLNPSSDPLLSKTGSTTIITGCGRGAGCQIRPLGTNNRTVSLPHLNASSDLIAPSAKQSGYTPTASAFEEFRCLEPLVTSSRRWSVIGTADF